LNGDTRLQSDLGIYGEDAIEFIERFSEKFNIDISGFNVDKYFRREGFDPFYTIKRMLRIESNANELTISDLEKAINNKKLE
jgi:acyl carrier protein